MEYKRWIDISIEIENIIAITIGSIRWNLLSENIWKQIENADAD